jgi:hypothetical protein
MCDMSVKSPVTGTQVLGRYCSPSMGATCTEASQSV